MSNHTGTVQEENVSIFVTLLIEVIMPEMFEVKY